MTTRYNHIQKLIAKKDYVAADSFMTEHNMSSPFVYAKMAICLEKDIKKAKKNNFSDDDLSALITQKNDYEYDSTHWGIEMIKNEEAEK